MYRIANNGDVLLNIYKLIYWSTYWIKGSVKNTQAEKRLVSAALMLIETCLIIG